jgi:hypothetical protein
MARVRSVNRAEKEVGYNEGGHLINIFRVHGWHLELDESVDFDMISSNRGPRLMRVVRCKPFTTGPWEITERTDAPVAAGDPNIRTFKPDNEDNFYFAEFKDDAGNWVACDGSEGHSDKELTDGDRACALKWFGPQWYQCNFIAH